MSNKISYQNRSNYITKLPSEIFPEVFHFFNGQDFSNSITAFSTHSHPTTLSYIDKKKFFIARPIQIAFKSTNLTPEQMIHIFITPEPHESLRLGFCHINNRLKLAEKYNLQEIISPLKKAGAITLEDEDPLHLEIFDAVSDNRINVVVQCMKEGANMNCKRQHVLSSSFSLLHFAIHLKRTQIVKLLLENKADVNVKEIYNGQTPLYLAVKNRHEEIVRLLIENKAKVNEKDNYGNTALSIASALGEKEIIRLLIESNPDLITKDMYDHTFPGFGG